MAKLVSTEVFSLLLAIFFAAALSPAHADQNPPAIFVFGDSLSDVGNNNNMPDGYRADYPHYGVDFPGGIATGRFTNGYNFIDVIAQHMGFEQSPPAYASLNRTKDMLSGVNFASAGSGILVDCTNGTAKECITMDEQIENFKRIRVLLQLVLNTSAASELISKSIFIFTCGGNDIDNFFAKNLLILDPPIDEYVANMTSKFRGQLKELYDLGARKFSIVNVPALGKTPPMVILDFIFQPIIDMYARKFNSAEEKMLKEISSTLPGMKYSIGNAYATIRDVTEQPEQHGMKNVVNPCCGRVEPALAIPPVNITPCTPDAYLCSNRNEYVFWDAIHPTQAVIKYAGELFYSGSPSYASPINLKQLVENEGLIGGVAGGLGGVAAM